MSNGTSSVALVGLSVLFSVQEQQSPPSGMTLLLGPLLGSSSSLLSTSQHILTLKLLSQIACLIDLRGFFFFFMKTKRADNVICHCLFAQHFNLLPRTLKKKKKCGATVCQALTQCFHTCVSKVDRLSEIKQIGQIQKTFVFVFLCFKDCCGHGNIFLRRITQKITQGAFPIRIHFDVEKVCLHVFC